jgi:phosphoglycolate phosphatase
VLAIGDARTELDAALVMGMQFIGIVAPHEPNPFPLDTLIYSSLAALHADWRQYTLLEPELHSDTYSIDGNH